MNVKERRAAALKAALAMTDGAKALGMDLTDAQRSKVAEHMATIEACDEEMKAAADDEALVAKLNSAGAAEGTKTPERGGAKAKAKSLGDHWRNELQAKGYNSPRDLPLNATVASSELLYGKAAADTLAVGSSEGAYGPLVTDLDTSFVMPHQQRLVIADLLPSGTVSGNAIKYPVFGALEGTTTRVAEGTLKPQLHVADPTWRTDELGEVAGFFKTTDDMAEDLPYMVSEINAFAVYNLSYVEEQQILFGDGTGNNMTGIVERSGIQTAKRGAVDSVADAIFRAMGKVNDATPFTADGVVLNPQDYEELRLNKDGNGQYFGGGYFGGQYGNGTILENPPVWGRRTVVTSAIPAGKVLVGAFNSAKLFEKGGIRVESTNSNEADFINDKITTRLRHREGLQVKYPAAFVYLDLDDVTA